MTTPETLRAQKKLQTGEWWALLHSPTDLPVIFATRSQALENREPDEYLVKVVIEAARPRDRYEPPSRVVPKLTRRNRGWKR